MAEVVRLGQRTFHGIPVSTGVCQGPIVVLGRAAAAVPPSYAIAREELPLETNRLERALVRTREQLLAIQDRVRRVMGAEDAAVFDAQLLVLDDPVLLDEVVKHMEREQVNVEQAFTVISSKYLATFAAIEDEYLRERVADMRDVIERILHNLLHEEAPVDLSQIQDPCILVADDLTPSQTAQLDKRKILGFATDQGSRTSHSAILARALQLPAVTGLQDATHRLRSGQHVLLDGFNGLLITDPTDQTLYEYGQIVERHLAVQDRLREIREQPAVTLDGSRIMLSANIEKAEESTEVAAFGAEGVGLFRTEYLFLNHSDSPSEEEQLAAYRQVAQALQPQPVIIRTLDIGGDKVRSHREPPTERNPFMGWRAIRICLQEPDLFRVQLRAILRASAVGNVKMMYPMISSLNELRQATELLDKCKAELRAEGYLFNEQMETGVMIEIPAAAMIADALAKRVQFFSIGTNDLIQYTIAVDRMNPRIAHLYEPTHPAVLRLIQRTVDAAHAHGLWCGVCGEMAGDPTLVPLLLGLGADELSATPASVPAVKYLIRRLKLSEARDLAAFAVGCENGAEVLARARALTSRVAPSLYEQGTLIS